MSIYETDFYTWTQQQAGLLKSGKFSEIDLVNIIEEIETMGRSEKRTLESRLTVLLQHLLKWHYQPARRGRSWQLTIDEQRFRFTKLLKDNPGLKPDLAQCLIDAYQLAIITASRETKLDKNTFPTNCPWDFAEIINPDFYPD